MSSKDSTNKGDSKTKSSHQGNEHGMIEANFTKLSVNTERCEVQFLTFYPLKYFPLFQSIKPSILDTPISL